MQNRPEFNILKKEVLGMVGLIECLEISPSNDLEKEFRRFTNIVTSRLPKVRKESINSVKGVNNDTTTENSAHAETKQ